MSGCCADRWLSVRRLNFAGGKVIADEQLIDNELDLLGIQIDMATPPTLEAQVA